jgi:hypothetical protein
MITKFGKRFLISHLAGNVSFFDRELALGIDSSTPNAKGNDTRLGFEIYRIPVNLGSIDITQTGVDIDNDPVFSYTAIYQGTIPQDISGIITEIGLYPSSRTSKNFFDSKMIAAFDNNLPWLDSNGGNPGIYLNDSNITARIGENLLYWEALPSASKEYFVKIEPFDLSGYSINDTLAIAYRKADDYLDKIRVKFYSSDNQYCYIDFTPTSGTGNKPPQSQSISNLFTNTSVTPPDFTNIIKIGIEITAKSGGPTRAYFDALRINDEDTFDPSYGMISRSVLTGNDILYKTSGRQVDIEYKLQLGF